MIENRVLFLASALAVAAFAAVVGVGLALGPQPGHGPVHLTRAIGGMAHETMILNCDIREP